MQLKDGKIYKEYYAIVKIYGIVRELVTVPYGGTKLGCINEGNIKIFERKKDANEWIKKNSYGGMSHKYEIVKLWNDKQTRYRWETKR